MNPFEFLPKPGRRMKFPGGEICCEQWVFHHELGGRVFHGKVVFKFEMDFDPMQPTVAPIGLADRLELMPGSEGLPMLNEGGGK